jgi:flagellar biosynthetic protein FliP
VIAAPGRAAGIVLLLASLARGADAPPPAPNAPLAADEPAAAVLDAEVFRGAIARTAPTVVIFAVASLVPAAVLMVTAFVRISVVLTLLRQALGSPQVPGNQVVTALALLLTALVMQPVADEVYARGIAPYAAGQMDLPSAWEAATTPIKVFMVDQIIKTRHENYLWTLYDYAEAPTPGRADPARAEEFPLRVVAPAFLLSELTTALVIGFALYLPFLVIDLVVSSVLAAMGLFMLPPSLVALPVKLILFVLADGWMLVAGMLLRSFGTS